MEHEARKSLRTKLPCHDLHISWEGIGHISIVRDGHIPVKVAFLNSAPVVFRILSDDKAREARISADRDLFVGRNDPLHALLGIAVDFNISSGNEEEIFRPGTVESAGIGWAWWSYYRVARNFDRSRRDDRGDPGVRGTTWISRDHTISLDVEGCVDRRVAAQGPFRGTEVPTIPLVAGHGLNHSVSVIDLPIGGQ